MNAAWKQPKGKSFMLDRSFPGIGRIARASGTDHKATHKAINGMLPILLKLGRGDLLAAIRDGPKRGGLAPMTVFDAYRRGDLDSLPSASLMTPAVARFTTYAKVHDCSDSYRSDLGTTKRKLERAGRKDFPLAELPKVLHTIREASRTTPSAFNRTRAHLLGFAGDAIGTNSPLYLQLKSVKRLKERESKAPNRRALSVVEFDRVLAAITMVESKHGNAKTPLISPPGALRLQIEMLCGTGMRPAEYWAEEWNIKNGGIFIPTGKTKAARRYTLALSSICTPFRWKGFIATVWGNATEKALGQRLDLYSLRRTFAHWLEEAGLNPTRIRAYLGHGKTSVTDIYTEHNVVPHIADDTRLVQAWIAAQRTAGQTQLVREAK